MKHVYVVIQAGSEPKVFTGLSAIARDCNIGRTTLSKAMNSACKYEGKDISVYRCEIVKGNQPGRRIY